MRTAAGSKSHSYIWKHAGSAFALRAAFVRRGSCRSSCLRSMTTTCSFPPLVSPGWLEARLNAREVSVLDASWYMPSTDRDAKREFCEERIPGSRFFDIDRICDVKSQLPHMLPSEKSFAAAADALGVDNTSSVIIYDRSGIFSAPRVWWTFRTFGHRRVAVLDGGYPAWRSEGREVDTRECDINGLGAAAEAAASPPTNTKFEAVQQLSGIRTMKAIRDNISSRQETVLDARSSGRFQGCEPEPRPGIRGGHIPGSLNLPFNSLLQEGRFRHVSELRRIFDEAGIEWHRPVVTTCGTGVTASILALGLNIVKPDLPVAVYDGSWMEWGGRQDTPVHTS